MAGIKVTMRQSYNSIFLVFDTCSEAGRFMDTAMESALKAGKEVSFVVGEETAAGKSDEKVGGKDA